MTVSARLANQSAAREVRKSFELREKNRTEGSLSSRAHALGITKSSNRAARGK